MAGIMDIGIHIPWRRLTDSVAGEAWGRRGGPGEKAVAGHDEDSATMAVAAALDSIGKRSSSSIGALYFVSVTSPYAEKAAASIIAAAVDLGTDIRTQDFGGSLRAGTGAMLAALDAIRAGSAGEVLVTAGDCRLVPPGSMLEMAFGDAGAAVLLGMENVAAEPVAFHSTTQETMDFWRTDKQRTVSSGDARFNRVEAYQKITVETCRTVMKKAGLDAKGIKKAVLTSPDGKGHGGVAKALGLDPKSVVDPMTDAIGMVGTAQPFIMLANALENSAPGDKLLLACYGDGCDALVFEVKEGVSDFKKRTRPRHASSRLKNYNKYLQYKELLSECESEFHPFASTIQNSREAPLTLHFHGKKCLKCATINTLNLRVCPHCGTRDEFESVRLGKTGTLNTYTQEHYYPTPEPPVTMAVVDLDGGARYLCQMTDVDAPEVIIGMKLEMTFRKLHDGGGYHNYCWKCRPVRDAGAVEKGAGDGEKGMGNRDKGGAGSGEKGAAGVGK